MEGISLQNSSTAAFASSWRRRQNREGKLVQEEYGTVHKKGNGEPLSGTISRFCLADIR